MTKQTSDWGPGYRTKFVYDPGWNLTNRAVNGAGTTYSVDDRNALSSGGSDPPYIYDANGNLTSKGTGSGTTMYVYDEENRLIRLTYGSTYKTEYAYDGNCVQADSVYTPPDGAWKIPNMSRAVINCDECGNFKSFSGLSPDNFWKTGVKKAPANMPHQDVPPYEDEPPVGRREPGQTTPWPPPPFPRTDIPTY